MSENIQINVTAADGISEIRLLQGEAPRHYDPVRLNIKGNIFAPQAFFLARHTLKGGAGDFNPASTYVHVNKAEGVIVMVQNDRSEFANTIRGELSVSKEFKDFQINTDKKFSAKELANHLRRRRHLFFDQQEGLRLIAELQTFSAKMNTTLADKDDKKGNTSNIVERSVTTNVPLVFSVSIPLFSGIAASVIQVELIVSTDSGSISFAIDSIDAIQQMEEMKEGIIEEAILPMKEYKIPIIEM